MDSFYLFLVSDCCGFLWFLLFSHLVMSDSLHHSRFPGPSVSPGVCSDSCPLSQWCHPTIPNLCCPLLLLSIFPSIRVFSNESTLHIRWPKYWNFSFSLSSSNEYSGLISFRIDWFNLLTVQRTLRSLLQHHSSKTSSLALSLFYGPTFTSIYDYWKNQSLTRRTFVSQVMWLLFNMLSMFVIAFLPRSKRLLISWLLWLSTVILEHKKIKFLTVSTFSPSICHEVMGLEDMILVFWMLISNQLFHSPLSPSSRGSLVPLCFLTYRWCHLHIWDYWYFSWQSWLQLELRPAWHFTWCTLHII